MILRKWFSFMSADWGLLFIRVGVGITFLVHGIGKFSNMEGTVAFFGNLGVPPFFAYLVGAIETLGGVAMLFGVFVDIAGVLLAVVLVFAIYLVKFKVGYVGGYEFDLLLLLSALGIACAGAGKYKLPLGKSCGCGACEAGKECSECEMCK